MSKQLISRILTDIRKKQYKAQLDELVISLDGGEFKIDLQTATGAEEFADVFTDLWEGL